MERRSEHIKAVSSGILSRIFNLFSLPQAALRSATKSQIKETASGFSYLCLSDFNEKPLALTGFIRI